MKFGAIDYVSTIGNVALVDIDSDNPPSVCTINGILRIVGLRAAFTCYSRTKRGWHIAIGIVERLTNSELVALQLCLGDDVYRGALNLYRVRNLKGKPKFWRERFNLLYEYKL